ncbi:MAG: DUF3175 domain-containing protein [Candidatus Eremiobacteraeota bacterium]|nr:DUF3175 domain-containing protein [Candidatus Eremiobacteraeota bacterium]
MPTTRRWSKHVNETSNALDIESGTFAKDDPKAIARALKRDAERSNRRKSSPYRSAMSMLTFFINRAGRNLPAKRLRTLEAAKDELRREFGREPASAKSTVARKNAATRKKTASRKKTATRKGTATRKKATTRKKAGRSAR